MNNGAREGALHLNWWSREIKNAEGGFRESGEHQAREHKIPEGKAPARREPASASSACQRMLVYN